MRIANRLTLLLTASALLLAAHVSAALASPLIDVWDSAAITLTDVETGKEPTLVIRMQLEEGFEEPPTDPVAVPVPEGSEVIWVGEILSADGSADVAAEDAELIEIDGRQYITFNLSRSGLVQAECTVPDGVITGTSTSPSITLEWEAPTDLAAVQVAAVVPSALAAQAPPAGVETTTSAGGTVYVRTLEDVKAGEVASLALTLGSAAGETPAQEAPAAGEASSGGESDSLQVWLLAGLGVALVGALAWLALALRRRSS